jgi:predicted PurR-regulated permease PerM
MPAPSHPQFVAITTGTILRTLLIFVGLGVAWLIRDILLAVFVAILLAGLIYPWADWAAKRRIPRGIAVLVFYLLLLGILATAFALIVPALLSETRTLIARYGGGELLNDFQDFLNTVRQLFEQYALRGDWRSVLSGLFRQASATFEVLSSIFGGIAGFLIVLVLSFYMVVEDSAVRGVFHNLVPERYQKFGSHVIWEMVQKLGGWLRGQLLLGLIIGALYFIGFSIIGVPYALLLALLGGLLEFIPYIGPFIAAVPAVFLAFTDSPWRALMALILILVIQQLENHVLVPKVMQRTVGLNPIISIIAVMVGFKLFHVVGAIFAIPVATAISVALMEVLRYRREHLGQK